MGFLWDLMQESKISDQQNRAEALEDRVHQLEGELHYTRQLLHRLISVLEAKLGEDIDGDGRVG